MSVSDRNINFRASDDTMREIAEIQTLFQPFLADRSSTLRWIIKTVWKLLFTDAKVIDAFRAWQMFSGNNSQHAELQMRISFPPQEGTSFFPKIWRAQ